MNYNKTKILSNICYTGLVYNRINKKLKSNYSKTEIEELIFNTIEETPLTGFKKIGKNIYASNFIKNIKVTINSNTFRIITVHKIK